MTDCETIDKINSLLLVYMWSNLSKCFGVVSIDGKANFLGLFRKIVIFENLILYDFCMMRGRWLKSFP